MLELMKYSVWRSEYDLAVMFNLINGLLPEVNATWARNVTKELREEILVCSLICLNNKSETHFFCLIFRTRWALMEFCSFRPLLSRRVITTPHFCALGIFIIFASGTL